MTTSDNQRKIVLISVYGNQEPEQGMYDRRLYELLEERKPWQNISHKSMPTFMEHVSFIRTRPYTAWYCIYDDNIFIGSIYLTPLSEVGLFIKEDKIGKGYGKAALQSLMLSHPKKYYLANIAPGNSPSIAFFTNMGFKHKYTTHEEEGGDILQFTHIFTPQPLSCDPISDEAQSPKRDLPIPVRECQ